MSEQDHLEDLGVGLEGIDENQFFEEQLQQTEENWLAESMLERRMKSAKEDPAEELAEVFSEVQELEN